VSGCVQPKPQTKEDIDQKGYVLKPNEGEIIFDDEMLLVKASPKSGTQGSVMVYDEMPKNGTSGIHYHVESDEFFYVLGGKGRILVGEEEKAIETGYFIFVPAGEDHRITSSVDDPLKVIYFVDKPGLAAQFREEGRLQLDRSKMTVEEFNEIVMKYGTVYKTFN
jgi:mannose-6-phosphate isomerase-like protein (cupin superfamily)